MKLKLLKLSLAYIILIVLFVVWMLSVWLESDITKRVYGLKVMELERNHIKSEIDKLQFGIISLKAPIRISHIAVNELGMSRISSDKVFRLERQN